MTSLIQTFGFRGSKSAMKPKKLSADSSSLEQSLSCKSCRGSEGQDSQEM